MQDETDQNVKQETVPRFSSFKPKQNPQKDANRSREKTLSAKAEDSRRRRHEHSPRHRHSEAGHGTNSHGLDGKRDRRDARDEHHKLVTAHRGHAVALHGDSRVQSEDSYVVDRKGDPHNLTYGTIHRYEIPLYRRAGIGYILGLPRSCRIAKENAEQQTILIRIQQRISHLEKYAFSRSEGKKPRTLKLRRGTGEKVSSSPLEDFISLNGHHSSKRRKLNHDSLSEQEIEDSPERDYRSIEGKVKAPPVEPPDKDLEYASATSDSDYEACAVDDVAREIREQNTKLLRQTDTAPRDLTKWTDLIAFQEKLFQGGIGSRPRGLTNAEKRSLADIKLSLYKKAMPNFDPSSPSYETLAAGQMTEGSKIWAIERQKAEWLKVVGNAPSSILLHEKYLEFEQSNLATFSSSKIKQLYEDSILKIAKSGQSNKEEPLIHQLLRGTIFLRESGFGENAIAIWQGLLELNFFMPKILQSSASNAEILAALETFWDDENPRIGESGACGWNQTIFEPTAKIYSNLVPSDNPTPPSDIPSLARWAEIEWSKTWRSQLPAKTMDDVDEDDPYRVTMFDDIKAYMHLLKQQESQARLLDAFLIFCGLPALSSLPSLSRSGAKEFLRTDTLDESLGNSHTLLGDALQPQQKAGKEEGGIFEKSVFPFSDFILSVDTLIPPEGSWHSVFKPAADATMLSLARRVLSALAPSTRPDGFVASYTAAFENFYFPSSAAKITKNILRGRPSDGRLCALYALIEQRAGRLAASEKTFSRAINTISQMDAVTRRSVIFLVRAWTWELFHNGNDSAIHHLLLATSQSQSLPVSLQPAEDQSDTRWKIDSAASRLVCQRALEAGFEDSLSSEDLSEHLAAHGDMLAILQYLCSDEPMESALQSYRSTISRLLARKGRHIIALELLHQHRARLLYHYARHVKPFKPAMIRETLADSIAAYPTNTIFLSLYAWNEARFRIADRVRGIMRDTVLKQEHESVIGWLFAVWHELQSCSSGAGYSSNTVRAVFERAVASESGKSNPSLWVLYIRFAHERLSPNVTKAVFFQALRSCPWVKAIGLLAFKYLKHVLSSEEQKDVCNIMMEKELRLHVDPIPLLEELGKGGRGREIMPLDADTDDEMG